MPTAWCGGRNLPSAHLHIYGQLEARLTESDRVILGGLVEGVWPPAPRVDPWLSRPMRHELGLDLPERRIGLSAHDFAQLLGTDDVILTHSAKVGGAPAVASRFLHRLEAVAGEARWDAAKAAGENYVRFAAELDQPDDGRADRAARAKAAASRRGRRNCRSPRSRTGCAIPIRSTRNIFCGSTRSIPSTCRCRRPIAARRSMTRSASSRKPSPTHFRRQPALVLRGIGEKYFAPLMERPEARALWWPRFQRIAAWFADWELARRGDIDKIAAEIRGEIKIPLDNERIFTLSARADRIEQRHDGSFAILDYKTGQPPTGKQVRMGLSPQLTLEAAILREGGFENIDAGSSVGELVYVRLSGNNPPGEQRSLELKIRNNDTPQRAGRGGRLRARTARSADPQIRERGDGLHLAEPVDVVEPLRRL